jgi:cardiolipin synthase
VKPADPGFIERLRPLPCDGNEIALLESGAEFFPSLVAAIDAARHEVWLETYIFANDETGLRVAAALARAAARGVVVRLLVDGFGTRALAAGIAQRLAAAGAQVLTYAPVGGLRSFDRERLRRLHRKQACIDARVAFVGGLNVLDDFWDPNHGALDHPRLDYAVRVRGPLVASVHASMGRLWRQLTIARTPLAFGAEGSSRARTRAATRRAGGADGDPSPAARDAADAAARAGASPPGRGLRALHLLRDNLAHRRTIERAYLKAIGEARREVLVANAYFLPGRRFRRALREAARRGVRVRLLLQGRAEYVLPRLAEQSLYGVLLDAGVEIVEYHRSFLHAKVAVIDDWATVGSSNIDPFSLLLAREANVVVFDAVFAAAVRERVLASMADGGRPVLHDEHARRPWTQRLYGWFATRMLRLGVAVTGHRHRY